MSYANFISRNTSVQSFIELVCELYVRSTRTCTWLIHPSIFEAGRSCSVVIFKYAGHAGGNQAQLGYTFIKVFISLGDENEHTCYQELMPSHAAMQDFINVRSRLNR
jgi:hypothetical protein